MGTIGGSLAFADPAADYLTALTAAEAEIETVSPRGCRRIPIDAFVTSWYTTVLAPDEIVTAVVVPAAPRGSLCIMKSLRRVSGDFAIVSIAVVVAFKEANCIFIRSQSGGCGPAPLRRRERKSCWRHLASNRNSLLRAGALLVEMSDPVDDVRATADYRRIVLPAVTYEGFDADKQAACGLSKLHPFELRVTVSRARCSRCLNGRFLEILRDELQITGPKRGCNQGVCGACTVLVDEKPVRACLSLVGNMEGHEICDSGGAG